MKDQESALGVELSDMIAQLRLELAVAMAAGEGERLRFLAESVELELKLTVAREAKGRAGIKFWVVDAGGERGGSRTREQTIKLKLLPRDTLPGGGEASPGSGRPALIAAERSKPRK